MIKKNDVKFFLGFFSFIMVAVILNSYGCLKPNSHSTSSPQISEKGSMTKSAKNLEPVDKPKITFPNQITYSTLKNSNMRGGPGTDYNPPLALIKAGTDFVSDGHTGKWYHGIANNKTGWIHASLLKQKTSESLYDSNISLKPKEEPTAVSGNVPETEKALPVSESQPAPAAQPESNSTPIIMMSKNPYDSAVSPQPKEEAPIASDNVSETEEAPSASESQPVPAVQPESGPAPVTASVEQIKSVISPGKAKIISAAPVRVRSQASQLSMVIEEVPPDAEVTVLENQGDWYKIKTSQNIGFVPAETLTGEGN